MAQWRKLVVGSLSLDQAHDGRAMGYDKGIVDSRGSRAGRRPGRQWKGL